MGTRQPTAAAGQKIWTDIEAMLATAMAGDEGTYEQELLLDIALVVVTTGPR